MLVKTLTASDWNIVFTFIIQIIYIFFVFSVKWVGVGQGRESMINVDNWFFFFKY